MPGSSKGNGLLVPPTDSDDDDDFDEDIVMRTSSSKEVGVEKASNARPSSKQLHSLALARLQSAHQASRSKRRPSNTPERGNIASHTHNSHSIDGTSSSLIREGRNSSPERHHHASKRQKIDTTADKTKQNNTLVYEVLDDDSDEDVQPSILQSSHEDDEDKLPPPIEQTWRPRARPTFAGNKRSSPAVELHNSVGDSKSRLYTDWREPEDGSRATDSSHMEVDFASATGSTSGITDARPPRSNSPLDLGFDFLYKSQNTSTKPDEDAQAEASSSNRHTGPSSSTSGQVQSHDMPSPNLGSIPIASPTSTSDSATLQSDQASASSLAPLMPAGMLLPTPPSPPPAARAVQYPSPSQSAYAASSRSSAVASGSSTAMPIEADSAPFHREPATTSRFFVRGSPVAAAAAAAEARNRAQKASTVPFRKDESAFVMSSDFAVTSSKHHPPAEAGPSRGSHTSRPSGSKFKFTGDNGAIVAPPARPAATTSTSKQERQLQRAETVDRNVAAPANLPKTLQYATAPAAVRHESPQTYRGERQPVKGSRQPSPVPSETLRAEDGDEALLQCSICGGLYPESMLDEHEQSELASMAGHGLTPVATAAPAPTTRPLAAIRTSSPKRANQSVPFQPTNPPGLLRGLRKEPSLAEVLFGESDSTTAAKGRAVKPLTGKQKGKARMRDDEDQDMTVHDEDGDWETIPDGWLEDLVPIQDSNVSIAAASRPQLAPPGPRQPSKPIKKFAAVIDIPDDDMDHVEGTVIAHQKRTSKTPLRQQQSRQITQEEQAEEFGIMNVGKSPAKGLILLSDLSVDDQDKYWQLIGSTLETSGLQTSTQQRKTRNVASVQKPRNDVHAPPSGMRAEWAGLVNQPAQRAKTQPQKKTWSQQGRGKAGGSGSGIRAMKAGPARKAPASRRN